MKQKLFVLLSLPIVILASACGKSDDQPAVTTVAPVAATCTTPGYVQGPNGCLPTQYGGYYNGQTNGGYYGQPVNVSVPTNYYCSGSGSYYGGWRSGWNSYNGSNCWNNGYSYRWSYSGGYYYYYL